MFGSSLHGDDTDLDGFNMFQWLVIHCRHHCNMLMKHDSENDTCGETYDKHDLHLPARSGCHERATTKNFTLDGSRAQPANPAQWLMALRSWNREPNALEAKPTSPMDRDLWTPQTLILTKEYNATVECSCWPKQGCLWPSWQIKSSNFPWCCIDHFSPSHHLHMLSTRNRRIIFDQM